MLKRIIVTLLFVFILSILFIEPVRNFMNNLFHKDTAEIREEQIIGTVSGYNPRVYEIQQILKDANFDPRSIDGLMGGKTRKAIKEFQKTKGLKPTGKIDTKTHLALIREKEFLANHKQKDYAEQISFFQTTEPHENLKSKEEMLKIAGSQNKAIKEDLPFDRTKQIQIALKKAGFYKGKIDGKLGPQTRRAVIAFQRSKGLKPDGVVGTKTWNELSKYLKD